MDTTDLRTGDYVCFTEDSTEQRYNGRIINPEDVFVVGEVYPETGECSLILQSRRYSDDLIQEFHLYPVSALTKLAVTPQHKLGEQVRILDRDSLPPVSLSDDQVINMIDAMYDCADTVTTVDTILAICQDDKNPQYVDFAYLLHGVDWLWRDDMLEPPESVHAEPTSDRTIEHLFDRLIGR